MWEPQKSRRCLVYTESLGVRMTSLRFRIFWVLTVRECAQRCHFRINTGYSPSTVVSHGLPSTGFRDPRQDLESRSPKFGTLTTEGYFVGTSYEGICLFGSSFSGVWVCKATYLHDPAAVGSRSWAPKVQCILEP